MLLRVGSLIGTINHHKLYPDAPSNQRMSLLLPEFTNPDIRCIVIQITIVYNQGIVVNISYSHSKSTNNNVVVPDNTGLRVNNLIK